jgi:hypothetical protein
MPAIDSAGGTAEPGPAEHPATTPESGPERSFAKRVKSPGFNHVSNPEKGFRIDEMPMVVIGFGGHPTEDQKGAMAAAGFEPIGDERRWAAPASEISREQAMRLNNEFSGQNLPYWPGSRRGGR